jgi:hypothetical protein
MKLLLGTVHGSRLYGLSHPGSDYDWFDVYGWEKGKARQKIAGEQDRTRTSYDRFMRGCEKGVPQFLEAMFSQQAHHDEMPFDRNLYYHPGLTNVRDVYQRTIKAFWMEGTEQDSFKLRRHSMRLVLNLRSMQESGRFNPTLTPEQVLWVNHHATLPEMTEAL